MKKDKDDTPALVYGPVRDKRRRIRVLKVGGPQGIAYGYARNISRSGMFITTMKPKDIGEQFSISFELPGVGKDVECLCKVIRKIAPNPNSLSPSGMGVRFLDLDEKIKDKIEEWVKKG